MSNKFFIITIFISNIAFGGVVPKIDLQKVINTKHTNKLTTKVSTQLFNRGLKKDIAKAKVKNSLMHDDTLNDIMVHNIINTIKTVNEKDVVDFLTQSALRGKKVDLSSYATLISLVQKSQPSLDQETLLHVEKVSLENEALKTMQVLS